MTHFPLPNGTMLTTYADYYIWANNTTSGVLGYGILLIVFAVVFFGTLRFGAKANRAFLASAVTTTMVSGALAIAQIIDGSIWLIFVLITTFFYLLSFHD